MDVIVGGTFGYLHSGHKALLKKAFEIGDFVCIGLTTDRYVKMNKNADIPVYTERKRILEDFARRQGKGFEIVPIDDGFGPSITGRFDAVVVSEGTIKGALEINRIRKERRLEELEIIKIGYVMADDSIPISTSRIIRKKITAEGRLIARKRRQSMA